MKKIFLLFFIFLVSKTYAQSGILWNASTDISTNSFSNMHPRITLDKLGNPLVIWGKMADKSVYFSRWNGTMFTTPIKLNPAWMNIATANWMGPDIASKGDTVYVVMKRVPEASDTNYIYIISSFDGGITFNMPVRVDNIADSLSRFPTVTIDNNGNPIVAFMKFDALFMDSRWVVTKSNNMGNTFNTDVKVSGWGASAEVCDCCPGAIFSSNNNCALMYRDNNVNIRDNWAAISNNNAVSFNNGYELENNNWMLMSCPASGPDGVIIGDSLYSVFMNGAGGSNRNYLSKSSISAMSATFTNFTGAIPGLFLQNFPRIAHDGNAVGIVWNQNVNGTTQLPLLFTKNITNGLPLSYDTVDLINITNSDVAMGNGKIYIVWQDDNSATVKYRSGVYAFPNLINETLVDDFLIYPNPVKDFLYIKTKSQVALKMELFNLYGEKIFYSKSNSSQSIDVSTLSTGLYTLKIQSGDTFYIKKLLIQ